MTPNQWPWSLEEEVKWEEELRRSELEKVGELIENMMGSGLGGAAYDPLQSQEEWTEEDVLVA